MRIPNVPQLVPVEKASKTAITNTIAGRKTTNDDAGPLIKSEMKTFAPRESVIASRARTKFSVDVSRAAATATGR